MLEQLFDLAEQAAVGASRHTGEVEGPVRFVERDQRAVPHRQLSERQVDVVLVATVVRTDLHRRAQGSGVEEQSHLVDLDSLVRVERGDAGTALRFDDDEAVTGQTLEGLSERRGGDSPLRRQLLGMQALTRGELAREDGPPEQTVDPRCPSRWRRSLG
ncbi:MAG: hypothetical protein RI958_1644 [Actinomycetota bacterium]